MTKFPLSLTLSVFSVACAGQSPVAETPSAPSSSQPEVSAETAPAAAPKAEQATALTKASEDEQSPTEQELLAVMPGAECEEGASCVPPEAFSKAVCGGRYPGLAIAMFEKNTPWQRRYVKVETIDPVNTYGGSVSKQPLAFTEEVLVLHRQGQGGDGMVVSGASDVDVLRWDGTCATVREEYLSEHRMPTIKNAEVNWRYLDKPIQEGLLGAKYVNIRYDQQRKACRGSSATNPSNVCANATEKLNDAITVAVRGGIELPDPAKLPAWKPVE